jgi:hypothetical protein
LMVAVRARPRFQTVAWPIGAVLSCRVMVWLRLPRFSAQAHEREPGNGADPIAHDLRFPYCLDKGSW